MKKAEANDFDWNEDIEEDLEIPAVSSLVVFSRDWTVETVISQIAKKNIDLNPKFQRRNVWDDKRKSRLIESLLLNILTCSPETPPVIC